MPNTMVKSKALVILLIIISSCSNQTFDTTEEIFAYITNPENEYQYQKTINGVDYTLQYKPTDLLVQQELGDSMNKKQIEALRKKYSKYMYFNLSMSMNGQELLSGVVQDKNKFGQMVNDLAFGMEEKVHLYTPQKDTLEMADFIYPRMYGMSSATTIMIAYPRQEKYLKHQHLNFAIQDLGLYTGEVKFKINTQQIQNEPQLSFK